MTEKPYIYFCADDFGITGFSCDKIADCVREGCLNKVSVLPNSELEDIEKRTGEIGQVHLSVHLNLVEGRCVGKRQNLGLLTDSDGYFKNTFTGLLAKSAFHRVHFKKQVKYELREQIKKARALMPCGTPLFLDSHQHTHMIPAVFAALCEVIEEDGLEVGYIRIPAEPVLPFLRTPSSWGSFFSVNFIKQRVLHFCFLFDKGKLERNKYPYACFFGILFSGDMNEKRVKKVLPQFIRYAKSKKPI